MTLCCCCRMISTTIILTSQPTTHGLAGWAWPSPRIQTCIPCGTPSRPKPACYSSWPRCGPPSSPGRTFALLLARIAGRSTEAAAPIQKPPYDWCPAPTKPCTYSTYSTYDCSTYNQVRDSTSPMHTIFQRWCAHHSLTVGETITILLHLLSSVSFSIGMGMGCQQNDRLADARRLFRAGHSVASQSSTRPCGGPTLRTPRPPQTLPYRPPCALPSSASSRWRDCHFDGTPFLSRLKHLMTVKGGAAE